MSVRLFIAGQEVELSNTTEVAVTRQAATAIDLEKRQVDFSNRINLPATTTNIAIMQNLGVNGNNSERPYKYASARLEINGITYADNLVSIVDDLGGNGYELRLLGNPFDAFQQMKGKQIRDVVDDFVDGGVHQLDIDSWKILQNASGGYTYPLISQLRPFPAFPKTRLYIDLGYPAFFTKDLMDKLLQQYFTSITGNVMTSDLYIRDLTFAADTETQVWKEWEFVRTDIQTQIDFAFAPIVSSIWFGFDFLPEIDNKLTCKYYGQSGDPDAYKFSGGGITVYESPANRKYKLKVDTQIQIGTLDPIQRYRLEIYLRDRSNVNIAPLTDNRIYESSWTSIVGTYQFEVEQDVFQRVDEGLYFVFKTENASTFVDLIIDYFTFEISVEQQSIFGDQYMNAKYLLPDCTEYEYFIDQIKRFGIIFQTYFDGSIRMESFKDVFSGAFGAQDWTNRIVEVTKTSYELGQYGKKNYIQYKGDRNGELLGGYNGWGFWDYDNDRFTPDKIVIESIGKAVAQSVDKLQPPFSNALQVGGYELNDNTDVILTAEKDLVYGRLDQNDQFASNYALWFLNDGAFTGNTGEVLTPFDFAANVSLAEMTSHVSDYFGNLIDSLERPVVREVEVYLSEVDFYQLDFFKLVYLEQFQKFHYLLSVENYIPGKTCKAKLLEVKGQLSVSKCCDYSVEGIELITSSCFKIIFPNEFAYGDEGFMVDVTLDVTRDEPATNHIFFQIQYLESEKPTITELLSAIESNFDDDGGRYVLTTGDNWYEICDTQSDVIGQVNGIVQGSFEDATENNIDFYGLFNFPPTTIPNTLPDIRDGFSFQFGIDTANTTTFQVLINDVWTDVTDEVNNGTWSRTNVCDDVITEWRIIDSEDNVIISENVTANCTF